MDHLQVTVPSLADNFKFKKNLTENDCVAFLFEKHVLNLCLFFEEAHESTQDGVNKLVDKGPFDHSQWKLLKAMLIVFPFEHTMHSLSTRLCSTMIGSANRLVPSRQPTCMDLWCKVWRIQNPRKNHMQVSSKLINWYNVASALSLTWAVLDSVASLIQVQQALPLGIAPNSSLSILEEKVHLLFLTWSFCSCGVSSKKCIFRLKKRGLCTKTRTKPYVRGGPGVSCMEECITVALGSSHYFCTCGTSS